MPRSEEVAAGRIALVTGACRGIGAAIGQALAERGHPVALVDANPAVRETAETMRSAGHDTRALVVDVSNEAAVERIPGDLADWWPRLAILVNNAGISPKHEGRKRPIAEMPTEEWRRVLDVNLTGSFLVTRTCLPALTAHGWGRVVMITSQAARTRTPVPGAHYAASKAGMTAFARVLAAEVAPFGVTVNCVAPGRVVSEMTDAVDEGVNANHAATIPLGRLGRPEEIAAAVAFLASDQAGYLTGATLDANGGSFMT